MLVKMRLVTTAAGACKIPMSEDVVWVGCGLVFWEVRPAGVGLRQV